MARRALAEKLFRRPEAAARIVEIHPLEKALTPRPICPSSISATLMPAAAKVYAVAQPVNPPPMMTTSN